MDYFEAGVSCKAAVTLIQCSVAEWLFARSADVAAVLRATTQRHVFTIGGGYTVLTLDRKATSIVDLSADEFRP